MSIQFNYDYMNKKGIQVCLSKNNGVNIKRETIEKWIEEGIEVISADQDRMEWFTTSGNALVLVYREEPGGMIHVYITKIEPQGYVEINN